MRAMGDRVTQDQTDPQYMFLRQRLAGLEEGWEELQRMWDNRQHLLSQGLNLQASAGKFFVSGLIKYLILAFKILIHFRIGHQGCF